MITQKDLKIGMVFKRAVGLREERIELIIRNNDVPVDKYGRWAAKDTVTGALRTVSEASLVCCWDIV